jgi:DNA gyrase subunit A
VKNRGGQGVINIKTTERNGPVVGLALCKDGDDVVLMTKSGMIVRSTVADLRPMGRNTAGVRIINLKEDDLLVGAEIVDASDLELVDEGGESQRLPIDPEDEAAAREEPEPRTRPTIHRTTTSPPTTSSEDERWRWRCWRSSRGT